MGRVNLTVSKVQWDWEIRILEVTKKNYEFSDSPKQVKNENLF
jgi:hypothetical protein